MDSTQAAEALKTLLRLTINTSHALRLVASSLEELAANPSTAWEPQGLAVHLPAAQRATHDWFSSVEELLLRARVHVP